jgi:hypothetical protein
VVVGADAVVGIAPVAAVGTIVDVPPVVPYGDAPVAGTVGFAAAAGVA